jgi:hypothetical protein
MTQENMPIRLEQLSVLSDYDVSDDSPDVRGWTVESDDGRQIGRVTDLLVDTDAMKATHLVVETGSERHGAGAAAGEVRYAAIAIPADHADVDVSNRAVRIPLRAARVPDLPRFTGAPLPGNYAARFSSTAVRTARIADVTSDRTNAATELRIRRRDVSVGTERDDAPRGRTQQSRP